MNFMLTFYPKQWNIRYIALTRAKTSLTFIESTDDSLRKFSEQEQKLEEARC